MGGLLQGQTGISISYDTPTAELMAERMQVTLPLAVMAMALTVAVALSRAAEPVAQALGREGIACWGGDFYAVRPLEAMGIDLEKGVLRMSSTHYTSAEDVSRLIGALDRLL